MAGRPTALSGTGFRSLFYGSLITNTGDGIRLAAFPLLADQLTTSPFVLATVTAAQYLPWVTFAPVGGVMVDRYDRRNIIVITQIFRGLIIGVLAVLVLTELVAIWHLCIVAFVITAGEILVDPAIVAFVPTVVDDEHLDAANGRIASVEILTNDFAGGPVGATTFASGPWVPFVIDAVTYLGSAAPFSRLPAPKQRSATRASVKADARAGLDFLRSHPVLGPLTISQVVYFFGVSTSLSLLVFLVRRELEGSAHVFGAVLAAGAIGAFAGSLIGGRVAEKLGRRTTLAGAVLLQGLALIGMASASHTWQLIAIWLLAGIPTGMQRPVARALQQRLTPNHLLGRVNVTARSFTRGVIIVGALTSGTIASTVGIRWAFVTAGMVELVAAGLMWNALAGADRTTEASRPDPAR